MLYFIKVRLSAAALIPDISCCEQEDNRETSKECLVFSEKVNPSLA